jgi:hypothetical protein
MSAKSLEAHKGAFCLVYSQALPRRNPGSKTFYNWPLTVQCQCHNFMKAVQNKLLVCITDGNKRVKPGRDRTNYAL